MRRLMQKLARPKLSEEDFRVLEPRLDELQGWPSFLQGLELSAIAPLVYRHFSEHDYKPPNDILLSLKALVMRHQAAADARYKVTKEITVAFNQAEIPLVALKGLALAPMIYASDELRPMRDIDVLVPRELKENAGQLLRELGFDLPDHQPSRFMRDSHQLPNATINVSGFTISVEIHHDALSRDVPGHLFFDDVEQSLQTVEWRDIELKTLGHEQMLHQVARHLAGLHPGAVLKLINVMDVVLYAEKYQAEIDWQRIHKDYSHVINTLKCLHYIVPLSEELQARVGPMVDTKVQGVGETMQPFVLIGAAKKPLSQKAKMLFLPPDWWMHLYYNVSPEKSLLLTKLVTHPMQVAAWLTKRVYSSLLGG